MSDDTANHSEDEWTEDDERLRQLEGVGALRPAWATETQEPDPETGRIGMHTGEVRVGDVTVEIVQVIGEPDFSTWIGTWGVATPIVDVRDITEVDAQGCRDLAAALLKAAEIIEADQA